MEDRNENLTKIKFLINIVLTIIFLGLISYIVFGTNILSSIKLTKEKSDSKQKESTVIVTPSPTQVMIVVDIQGAVKKPGVYKLTSGSRVVDLLLLTEGFTDDSDSNYIAKNLNQASILTDGSKIYIPFKNELNNLASTNVPTLITSNPSINNPPNSKVNINTASRAELIALPEIGEVTADKIINARPYTSLDQVVAKDVMKQGSFDKIKELITI